MDDFKFEMIENEKEAYAQADLIKEQNRKMMEIDEKLHDIDQDVNKGKEYERGLSRGFFGFIPDFFTSIFRRKKKKYKNDKIIDPLDEKIRKEKKEKKKTESNDKGVQKVENDKDFQDLMDEINQMNKGAKVLKNEAIKSKQIADDLEKHMNYTNKGVEEITTKARKILNK